MAKKNSALAGVMGIVMTIMMLTMLMSVMNTVNQPSVIATTTKLSYVDEYEEGTNATLYNITVVSRVYNWNHTASETWFCAYNLTETYENETTEMIFRDFAELEDNETDTLRFCIIAENKVGLDVHNAYNATVSGTKSTEVFYPNCIYSLIVIASSSDDPSDVVDTFTIALNLAIPEDLDTPAE